MSLTSLLNESCTDYVLGLGLQRLCHRTSLRGEPPQDSQSNRSCFDYTGVSAYYPNSVSVPKLGTSYPCCPYMCHDQKCRFLEYLDYRDQSLLLTSGQSLWTSSFFFYAASTFVKVSIVLFYKRVFTTPKFQIVAWTMIALLIIWGIGISLVKFHNVHQSLHTNYVT